MCVCGGLGEMEFQALESRNRDHDSAITSEQESVAQSLLQGQTNLPGSLGPESRKKVKS